MTTEKLELHRQQNMEHYGFGPSAMKKIRVCTHCGTSSQTESHFCVECGHRLPDKTLYDLYRDRHEVCFICDTILTEEMDFCPKCGMRLRRSGSAVFEGVVK